MSGSLINSIIYENGVVASLKNNFALLLLADNDEIVASSACINGEGLSTDGFIAKKLNWLKDLKTITVDSFDFSETRSGEDLGDTSRVITSFEIVKLEEGDYDTSVKEESYAESGKQYVWPKFKIGIVPKEENIYFKGKLANDITIQKGNNFRFQKTEIKFSEIQNI